jgi:hypothetical protein
VLPLCDSVPTFVEDDSDGAVWLWLGTEEVVLSLLTAVEDCPIVPLRDSLEVGVIVSTTDMDWVWLNVGEATVPLPLSTDDSPRALLGRETLGEVSPTFEALAVLLMVEKGD